MALPAIGDGEQVGDGNTGEQLNVGAGTQPVRIGGSTSGTLGVLGATPTTRKTFIATQSINALSVSGVVGFTSSASLSALIEKVNSLSALVASFGFTASS